MQDNICPICSKLVQTLLGNAVLPSCVESDSYASFLSFIGSNASFQASHTWINRVSDRKVPSNRTIQWLLREMSSHDDFVLHPIDPKVLQTLQLQEQLLNSTSHDLGQIAGTLKLLSTNAGNDQFLTEPSILALITKILSESEFIKESISIMLATLETLSDRDDTIKCRIVNNDHNLIRVLVTKLTSNSDRNVTKRFTILYNLALAKSNQRVFASFELGMIRTLTSFAKCSLHDHERSLALLTLGRIAFTVDHGVLFLADDLGLLLILSDCITQLDMAETRMAALCVIRNLSCHEANRVKMASLDYQILHGLLFVARRKEFSLKEHINVWGTLKVFALSNELKAYLTSDDLGLVSTMMSLLRDESSVELYAKVLEVVWNLAASHSDNKIYFAAPSLGLLPLLRRLLEYDRVDIQIGCLGVLTALAVCNTANQILILNPQHDFLPILSKLFLACDNDKLNLKLSSLFWILAKAADNKAIFARDTKALAVITTGMEYLKANALGFVEDVVHGLSRDLISPAQMNRIASVSVQVVKSDVGIGRVRALKILLSVSSQSDLKLLIEDQVIDVQELLQYTLQSIHSRLQEESLRSACLEQLVSLTGIGKVPALVNGMINSSSGLIENLGIILKSSELRNQKISASSVLWNYIELGHESAAVAYTEKKINTISVEILQEEMIAEKMQLKLAGNLLNLLMNMARHYSIRDNLKNSDLVRICQSMLVHESDECNTLKALIILLFLFGSEEQDGINMHGQLPIVATREHIQRFMDIFKLTLNSEGGKDFVLGTFCLALLVDVCMVISQSDSNKQTLIDLGCLPLLTRTLWLFTSNSPPIYLCGGGGKDLETAQLCIEVFTQLSFQFEDDLALRSAFLPQRQQLLEMLPVVATHSLLQSDSRKKAQLLFDRLTQETIPRVSVKRQISVVGRPRHVIVSYCWHPSAQPDLVKRLANELRSLGYDVWRDEDGSNLVPPMSGSIDDRMAEAVDNCDTAIICVSPAYKLSSNCRLEAQYANILSKRGKVKLVFAMMNENYTTTSSPEYCDGWLGLMVGGHMWHPMWRGDMVSAAVMQIASQLPDNVRRDHDPSARDSLLNTLQSRTLLLGGDSPDLDDSARDQDQIVNLSGSFSGMDLRQLHSPESTLRSQIKIESSTDKAWAMLNNPASCKDESRLRFYLSEQGIFCAEDLCYCTEQEVQEKIVPCLKSIQARRFLDLMLLHLHHDDGATTSDSELSGREIHERVKALESTLQSLARLTRTTEYQGLFQALDNYL